jgi:hypothetical protein
MEHRVTAVYDANILYPAPLRDLFIRVAQAGLVRARWTETIHEEWIRNVLKDNPPLSAERLARTRGEGKDVPMKVKCRHHGRRHLTFIGTSFLPP